MSYNAIPILVFTPLTFPPPQALQSHFPFSPYICNYRDQNLGLALSLSFDLSLSLDLSL